MKLSDAVAIFLERQGITHIFGVNGGANLHILHSIYEKTKIKFICTAHEQGAGFAADAYARIKGFGVATATSGPGATNLVTSIAAAWQDSVPVLYVTGNVATFRRGTPLGVRSYGFQELEFCDMVRGVTKYAVQVQTSESALPAIALAIHKAQEGRKGPVVVDIPDDLQRADIDYR